ncbi:MAG: glutaminase A [Tissierellaceae bacterium]|nr:glutaminase A [Tissierellaceae bacterium]
MENLLQKIVEENRLLTEKGNVADYIPALAKVNQNHIGICVVDLDGNIYKAGNYDTKFTLQSISKVISLALAVMDNGQDYVFERVGYEGTDEPFNTLYKLDLPHITKPANPMINAGAILTTSLVNGNKDEKFQRILELTRTMANNPDITYNEEVYLSEKETGDKNRALANIMKARGMLIGDVEDILDSYFKQCSIEVTAIDLANIGAFLASGCIGLESYGKATPEKLRSILLGIMATSGMYNYSGQYAVEVGVPSKSGVGGGIMAAVPNKLGIGTFGPTLDYNGNSSAGQGMIKSLAKEYNLNMF